MPPAPGRFARHDGGLARNVPAEELPDQTISLSMPPLALAGKQRERVLPR